MSHTIKRFNSSEDYSVIDTGVRCLDFDVAPGQTAHLILTAYKLHKPIFTVYRQAGVVCAKNCPTSANLPIVGVEARLSQDNYKEVITTPGHYYLHSINADWMSDPCHPLVVEVHIG